MQYARNVVFVCASLLAGSLSAAAPANPAFDAELLSIQQAWARVNYEMPAGDERAKAFEALEKRAENFTHQNPARPEALIWEGIIESSYAGAKGGLGALSLCKEARGNLESGTQARPERARRIGLHEPRRPVLQGARLPGRLRRRREGRQAAAEGAQAEPERHRPELLLRGVPVRAGPLPGSAAVPRQGRQGRTASGS